MKNKKTLSLSVYWPHPVCFSLLNTIEMSCIERQYYFCMLWSHYDNTKSLEILDHLPSHYQNLVKNYMMAQEQDSEVLRSLKNQIEMAIRKCNIQQLQKLFTSFSGKYDYISIQYYIYCGCSLITLYKYHNSSLIPDIIRKINPFLKFKSVWFKFKSLVYYSLYLMDNNIEWIKLFDYTMKDYRDVLIAVHNKEYPPFKDILICNYTQSKSISNITEKKKMLLPCLNGTIVLKVLALIELYKIYCLDEIGVKIKLQIKCMCKEYKFYELLDYVNK